MPPAAALAVEYLGISTLIPYARNARTHSEAQVAQIAASIREFGFTNPVLIDEKGSIIAGHGRVMAARVLEMEHVPTIALRGLSDAQKRAYIIADNKLALNAGWDLDMLRVELDDLVGEGFDLDLTGFSGAEMSELWPADGGRNTGKGSGALAEKFGIPPFTVFNAREGWWQARKAAWLALGIKSEVGRGEVQGSMASARNVQTGGKTKDDEAWVTSSIFDPVLCEIAYRWFSAPGARVLDPFAGGSVRGVVAAKLGRKYFGVDLRAEQVEANRLQWLDISQQHSPIEVQGEITAPTWYEGNSQDIGKIATDAWPVDFIFSCPPYADLEVYSDDKRDLSTMRYPEFKAIYAEIIREACALLAPDSFACFVVGDVRDKAGNYYGFPWHTIEAFQAAGLQLYNEAVLVTAVGSLPIRVNKSFTSGRKLGKTHQNVLVFLKGNAKKAVAKLGDVEFGDVAAAVESDPTLGSQA